MNKQTVLTDEGLKKLEEELNYLKSTKRKDIAEKIKTARGFGDLSENSEYDEAKNEQAIVEERIATLEALLKNVTIIDHDDLSTDAIALGTKVKVLDIEFNEEEVFSLVGSTEVDPTSGKISDESPIGKGLLGHKVDDIIDIETPGGVVQFKVLEIFK